MFGTFTRPVGNDSPAPVEPTAAPEVKETSGESLQEVTESETVENASEDTATDTTTEDTDSEETGDDVETEVVKKPKKGFERRIEKFNQKLSAKDQEIEYWKRAALGGTNSEAQPVQEQAPKGRPAFSDYNDIEAFTEALTDWKVSQALGQVQQKQQIETVAKTYEARLEAFKQSTPDFQEVMDEFVEDYGDRAVPEIVQTALDSEVGPAIAYYFAKNTSEVDRIAALPPHRRLIELGKLEDRLSKSTTVEKKTVVEETKKVSKANPPITAVKSTGKVETNDIYADLPYEQWVKIRTKKK